MTEMIVSVDRALDILLTLYYNGEEMGISEIGRKLDIHKSTVHRTLATLENKGFVYQNTNTNRYWLGTKIYAMGLLIGEKLSLADLIKPYSIELFNEFKEVINVSILDKDIYDNYKTVIILKESDTRNVLSVNPNVGSSSDIHVSSVGKCLMAFSKDIDLSGISEKSLIGYTENTFTNWEDLLRELEIIKKNGYAIDNEELEIGLFCIGAPILDKNGSAIAAISMSGPTARMKGNNFEQKIIRLIEVSQEISYALKEIT